jgi:membrane protein implicated in regulation of membrane protease activity
MAALLWAILGAGLLATQLFTGLLDFLFPAIAALIVAALSLIPGFSEMYWLQGIIWASLSLASVLWLRIRYKHLFTGRELKIDSHEHSGREARVIEEIRPGIPGRISYQGTSWNAVSISEVIPVGCTVTILDQESMTFTVTARPLIDSIDTPPQIRDSRPD